VMWAMMTGSTTAVRLSPHIPLTDIRVSPAIRALPGR